MTSDPSSSLILFAALLFLVSILATVVTPRVGVPLLLVFLVIGMLAGADGPGGIHFQDYSLANLAVTAALAVDRKSTRLNSTNAHLVCRLLLEKQKRKNHT